MMLLHFKEKKGPTETILRMEGRGIKENDGGDEFSYDML
jgi:hypothetical protein